MWPMPATFRESPREHRPMRHPSRTRWTLAAPALALILAVAAQALWALLAGWIWETGKKLNHNEQVNEQLLIRKDGTPLIVRSYYAGSRYAGRQEVRTLDGKRVPAESADSPSSDYPSHAAAFFAA